MPSPRPILHFLLLTPAHSLRDRRLDPACPYCDYLLIALPSASRCPECGTPIDWPNTRFRTLRPSAFAITLNWLQILLTTRALISLLHSISVMTPSTIPLPTRIHSANHAAQITHLLAATAPLPSFLTLLCDKYSRNTLTLFFWIAFPLLIALFQPLWAR